MTTRRIPATEKERALLALAMERLRRVRVDEAAAKKSAAELFTMFAEAHGVADATFEKIDQGDVVVTLPEGTP